MASVRLLSPILYSKQFTSKNRGFCHPLSPIRHPLNDFFDLLEVQLDGRIATEDGDQYPQFLFVRIDLFDLARKFGEGTGGHAHDFALIELDHRDRRMALDRFQDMVHLSLLERDWLVAR